MGKESIFQLLVIKKNSSKYSLFYSSMLVWKLQTLTQTFSLDCIYTESFTMLDWFHQENKKGKGEKSLIIGLQQ